MTSIVCVPRERETIAISSTVQPNGSVFTRKRKINCNEREGQRVAHVTIRDAKRLRYRLLPEQNANSTRDNVLQHSHQRVFMTPANLIVTSTNGTPLTEADFMRAAVTQCLSMVPRLQYLPANDLKVFHSVLSGRRHFGAISTFCGETALLGIVWQSVVGGSPKFICLTLSMENQSGLKVCCSCDPIAQSNCEHARGCIENTNLSSFAMHKLGDPETFVDYFGNCTGRPHFPVTELVSFTISQSHYASMSSTWTPWVVFDKERKLFVPVMKKRKQKFQCQSCRGTTH